MALPYSVNVCNPSFECKSLSILFVPLWMFGFVFIQPGIYDDSGQARETKFWLVRVSWYGRTRYIFL